MNASNNQHIIQFEGSAVGTTIPNLQPGTYVVNEIKFPENFLDQLRENMDAEINCASFGFPDGERFFYDPLAINYLNICFEYEDQPGNVQGNNCNTITLAAGFRQMNFNKFHKWLNNPDELHSPSREKADCMKKVKNLAGKEKSSYNSGKIWDDGNAIGLGIRILIKRNKILYTYCYYDYY